MAVLTPEQLDQVSAETVTRLPAAFAVVTLPQRSLQPANNITPRRFAPAEGIGRPRLAGCVGPR